MRPHGAHEALEYEARARSSSRARLLFSTGYMANLGIVTALLDRATMPVFADRLNHASLNDAALLSRAYFHRYPHGDLLALERCLAASLRAPRKLVATDAVFSMDGDIAPVPRLARAVRALRCLAAASTTPMASACSGDGRGVLSHFGIDSPNLIYMGTLGKAAGVFGAFVAGDAP